MNEETGVAETRGNVPEFCSCALCAYCGTLPRSSTLTAQNEIRMKQSRKGGRSTSQMPVLGLAMKVDDTDLSATGTGGDV